MSVLLTRPAADSARIAALLADHGIPTLTWPLTRISADAEESQVTEETEALLFTSPYGVQIFADYYRIRSLPALCVGDRTATVARDAGFSDVQSASGDASGLVVLAIASGHRSFVHLRGRQSTGDLAGRLRRAGLVCKEEVIYSATPAGRPDSEVRRALAAGQVEVVTIWSPRNGALLAGHLADNPGWNTAGTDLVAISQNALEPLLNTVFRRKVVAARPDADAMIETVRESLRQ